MKNSTVHILAEYILPSQKNARETYLKHLKVFSIQDDKLK